ncbi:MAG TPA: M50 family metallopeptidase [Candidatus Acidoferrum sp.]|nr:M50 family metallopeptidase [Candidatus Acidoferrum sp.]
MAVVYLIIGILLFVSLIVLHEAGHAYAARRNGVELEEFGIGFPPKFWSKRLKNGTLFSLNILPIGGFVRMKGEHDSATGKGTYGGATLWAKVQILLAGVVVNWLVAVVIFAILALVGLPQLFPDQFTVASDTTIAEQKVVAAEIIPSSPAARAGIKPEDYIVSLNGEAIRSAAQLAALTKSDAGRVVGIVTNRGGENRSSSVLLNQTAKPGQGYAGIAMGETVTRRSTWSAPLVGVGVTIQFTGATFSGLGGLLKQLFVGQFQAAGQQVAGPVGIFSILQQSSQVGFGSVLFLIGIISLTLAVMNCLPIPALDGGRLAITLITHAIKRPLNKRREESIQAAGFAFLLLLIIVVTVADVGKITGK